MIPFYKHNLKKNKNYLKDTIASPYLTSGPVCEKTENLLKIRFKKKFAIMSNSWTNALISILLSLKLKPKDEVMIPACTFVACANVIEMVGAKVVFVDIDPNTKLMDLKDCFNKISKNTRVIMPVHLYGNLFNTFELKKKYQKIYLLLRIVHMHFVGSIIIIY